MTSSRWNHRLALAALCLVMAAVVRCSDPVAPEPEIVENQPPQANDDTAETGIEAAVVIDVLTNDTDPDGTLNPASVTVTAAPDSGGTDVNPETGAITYAPNPGFFGTDSLQYTVDDREALTSNAATVVITVLGNKPPVAEDDEATTDEDTPVVIDVLANDLDPEGALDPSSLTIVTPPAFGTARDSTAATRTLLVYDPNPDFFGTDTLAYTVNDLDGLTSAPARVVITVNAVNDAPVARDTTLTIFRNDTLTIDLPALATDPDSDLDPAAIVITDPPGNGAVEFADDGTEGQVRYIPNSDFVGSDDFEYTVSDVEGAASNEAEITIQVTTRPPLARADTVVTAEDSLTVIDVLVNDEARDSALDSLSVAVADAPRHGAARDSTTATRRLLLYEPDTDFSGVDSLTYTVRDEQGTPSAPASVFITITPVNDAPVFTSAPTDTSVAIGDTLTLPITVTDIDTDPADVTLTASQNDDDPLPDWLVLTGLGGTNGAGTATLTARPTDAVAPGTTVEITLRAGDGEAESTRTFMLTVTDSSN